MTYQNITHVCGHVREIKLTGNMKTRDNRIEYLESCLCPDCQASDLADKSNLGLIELNYKVCEYLGYEIAKGTFNHDDYTVKAYVGKNVTTLEEAAKAAGYDIAEVHYSDYKNNNHVAIEGTYNKETKTIAVFIPHDDK